ncbi:45816_t:CDS:10, partial [Gigaspora margarita]
MPLNYVSICIALYDYTAQNDDEISFKEDDILYILENDDEEWWKAKLKIEKSEGDENTQEDQIGLVPSNYIQEAECKSVLKAVYDYEAQSNEELSFKEDDIFYLYDKDEADWYLVKSNDIFGYIPANYVEETSIDSEEQEQQENQEPMKKMSLFDALSSSSDNKYVDPLQLYARKVATQKSGTSSAPDVKTWSVSKKKKKKGKLSIGGENIYYASETDKTPVQIWKINDLEDVKYEKKNVTIKFGGPKSATFNFQTASKSDAEAIYRQYGECAASLELPTVNIDASSIKSPRPSSAHDSQNTEESESQADVEENETEEVNEMELPPLKVGIALYDFDAQGDDEISIQEGDEVWIIDDVSSNEWWKCRKGDEEGMVPSSYIKIQNEDDNADQDAAEEERQRLEEEEYQKAEEERLRKEEERMRKEEERLRKEERQRKEEERQRKEEERQRKEEERQRKEEERHRREESDRKRKESERRLLEEKKRKQESESPPSSPPQPPSPPPQPPTLPSRPPAKSKSSSDEAAIKKIQTPTNRNLPDRPAQAQSKDKPLPSNTRTWTDRTGSFRVEAEFLQLVDGKVHLHKLNGIKIAVPIDRMSKNDIAYLEKVIGGDKSDNIPLAAIVAGHKGKTTLTNKNKSEYDWFDFFLKADITHDDAFNYAKVFINENMDESSINNLNRNVMKELGLKEGDIIRVTKYIDESKNRERKDKEVAKKVQFEEPEKSQKMSEFDVKLQMKRDEQLARELQEEENKKALKEGRPIPKDADLYGKGTLDSLIQRDDKTTSPKTPPLLFSENNGVLKNNTKKTRPTPTKTAPIQVDAKTFVNAMSTKDQVDAAFKPSSNSSSSSSNAQKFDDDAWNFTDSTPAANAPTNFNTSTLTSLNPSVSSYSSNLSTSLPAQLSQPLIQQNLAPPPPPPPSVTPRSPLNNQLVSANALSNLNTSALTSLSPAVSSYSSNSSTSFPAQLSQPLIQQNLATTPPPPSQPIVVPLNSTLQQPLIPVQQYMTTTTTVQYHQTTAFHQPMQNQQPNSSMYDPKNVFASMKAGQIGPKLPPNDLSADRYDALKQVNLQGPSVFNNTSTFQAQTDRYDALNHMNLQGPGVFNNTSTFQAQRTTGFSNWNQGVNPNFGVGGIQPNPGFGLGQQHGQMGPNQQGFGPNTGYNTNQQPNNFNQGGFNNRQ